LNPDMATASGKDCDVVVLQLFKSAGVAHAIWAFAVLGAAFLSPVESQPSHCSPFPASASQRVTAVNTDHCIRALPPELIAVLIVQEESSAARCGG